MLVTLLVYSIFIIEHSNQGLDILMPDCTSNHVALSQDTVV